MEKNSENPIDKNKYIIPKQNIIEALSLDTSHLNMILTCVTKQNTSTQCDDVFFKKTVFLTENLIITETDDENSRLYNYKGKTMEQQEFLKYIKLIHFK